MTDQALVLFAHGARNPQWAAPMERMRDQLRQRDDALLVELAFLEFIAPDLPAAVAALHARGVRRITVVPIFLARGGHLQRDLPQLIAALESEYADCRFRLADAAGESDGVVKAMADYALACADW